MLTSVKRFPIPTDFQVVGIHFRGLMCVKFDGVSKAVVRLNNLLKPSSVQHITRLVLCTLRENAVDFTAGQSSKAETETLCAIILANYSNLAVCPTWIMNPNVAWLCRQQSGGVAGHAGGSAPDGWKARTE